MKKALGSLVGPTRQKYLNLAALYSPKKSIVKNLFKEQIKLKNKLYKTNNFLPLEYNKNILLNIPEGDLENLEITDESV
jgi:hypothetical protein